MSVGAPVARQSLPDEQAMLAFGASLARQIAAPAIVHLEGDLGAGKTTLARGFIAALGHSGTVRSPTYTMIESYLFDTFAVHHLDLYRVGSAEELYDLGVTDLLDEHALWLIEWPAVADRVLPPWTHRISLSIAGAGRDVELALRTN